MLHTHSNIAATEPPLVDGLGELARLHPALLHWLGRARRIPCATEIVQWSTNITEYSIPLLVRYPKMQQN